MELNLVADTVAKGRIYPALAQHQGRPYTPSWREFGAHYPYTIPLRLQEYCDHHNVKINIYNINEQLPPNTFYSIGLGFFDFDIDYIGLLPPGVRDQLDLGSIKLLFYYHEGDNPFHIKKRLDNLCAQHQLPDNCYVFVSANTAAKSIPGFVYFNDFELWYWQRNEHTPATNIHDEPRERDFTVLNRLHKSWRATAMADLHRKHLLKNSYWSYCETGSIVDADNPIQIDEFKNLRADTDRFLAGAPYISDELSMEQRNNHSIQEPKYFVNAYCNIVMETHFDADGCAGTFLTEKTFKPIKHGQLFFVAGPAGSLQLLRDMGYRVFDKILDNSYDRIADHTQRWRRLCSAVEQAQYRLKDRFEVSRADIEHNQQLFLQRKTQRLNILLEHINESY
jgi:hypothetical protein